MARLIFTGLPCEGVITGRFGQVAGYGYPHRGVDIAGNNGKPIYSRSTQPARSVAFTNDGSFGNAVCLQHDDDGRLLFELNAHMSRKVVNVGDVVQPGQLIGYVGATGRVTGPHDHWDLCDSPSFPLDIRRHLDPLLFIGEEEDMDARVRHLMRIAVGDFAAMEASYNALVTKGFIANDLAPLAYDGGLGDLNGALVRRFRIMELAMADNFAAAYAAIGG